MRVLALSGTELLRTEVSPELTVSQVRRQLKDQRKGNPTDIYTLACNTDIALDEAFVTSLQHCTNDDALTTLNLTVAHAANDADAPEAIPMRIISKYGLSVVHVNVARVSMQNEYIRNIQWKMPTHNLLINRTKSLGAGDANISNPKRTWPETIACVITPLIEVDSYVQVGTVMMALRTRFDDNGNFEPWGPHHDVGMDWWLVARLNADMKSWDFLDRKIKVDNTQHFRVDSGLFRVPLGTLPPETHETRNFRFPMSFSSAIDMLFEALPTGAGGHPFNFNDWYDAGDLFLVWPFHNKKYTDFNNIRAELHKDVHSRSEILPGLELPKTLEDIFGIRW